MAQDFYPFVQNDGGEADGEGMQVRHPARIAVYDDAAAAPRVVVVEPKGIREYLEEITLQVTQLSTSQGGTIPFMVIREIVENLIHAYFMEPTISILDHGNTIRFSDQGPGIAQKDRALQYGTTSATEEMRRYIRGVGSGLPYVQQYMRDKGGRLEIDDNISGGTVVTISTMPAAQPDCGGQQTAPYGGAAYGPAAQSGWQQAPGAPQQPWQGWQQPQYPWPQQQGTWQQAPQQQYPWPAQTPQQPQQGYYPQRYAQAPQGSDLGAAGPAAGTVPTWATLTVRGRAIVDYLMSHDSVGPSDLARAYGESQPTWTRELQALEEQGIIRKDGQKRRLTAMGRSFAGGA